MSRSQSFLVVIGRGSQKFFKSSWRRVVAIIVVLAVGVGGGLWFYHEKQIQSLRHDALVVEVTGWKWMESRPFCDCFERYVASTDQGVDFFGWKTTDPAGLKKVLAAYNAKSPATRKISYEHLVKVIGPGFREVVAKMGDSWHNPVEYFFDWCHQKMDMVNVKTGEIMETPPVMYEYWSHPERFSPNFVLRSKVEAQ